jgi:predicted ester cyclase
MPHGSWAGLSMGDEAVPHHLVTKKMAEELKREAEDAFNARDTKALEQRLAPGLIDHNTLLGGTDLRQRMSRVLQVFPDATFKVEDYILQGNAVAWRWTIKGTHTKRIMGVEPTNKPVTLSGLSVAVISDGRIVEHWEFSDDLSFMEQLQREG